MALRAPAALICLEGAMAKLTAKQRRAIPTSKFGLPEERKYPLNNPSHAANAKSRASQQEAKGNITPSQKATIFSKANKVLDRKA